MKTNYTPLRRYKTGRAKSVALRRNKKAFSSDISQNYRMMLQLYCLTKKENAEKKQIKYRIVARLSDNAAAKPRFSISATIMAYLNENVFSFR